jgi:hypothetical protein
MMTVLTDEQKAEFVNRDFSRRHFGRLRALLRGDVFKTAFFKVMA